MKIVNLINKFILRIQFFCIYADYKSDESYTPSRIVIKAGTHVNDLREIGSYDLLEPAGWIIIPLKDPKDVKNLPIKTWMLQLAVLANHQNGRDTHIRQIKIHSPIETTSVILHPKFSAVEIGEWSSIR